jgi:hypothetical protein
MLKAIETIYNGYRFRSRLEARWAVFFDALGIKYVYEEQGYKLTRGHFSPLYYLPDFKLPEYDCWIEIKGQEPTRQEKSKAHYLTLHSKRPCYIFAGNIGVPDDTTVGAYKYHFLSANLRHPEYKKIIACQISCNLMYDVFGMRSEEEILEEKKYANLEGNIEITDKVSILALDLLSCLQEYGMSVRVLDDGSLDFIETVELNWKEGQKELYINLMRDDIQFELIELLKKYPNYNTHVSQDMSKGHIWIECQNCHKILISGALNEHECSYEGYIDYPYDTPRLIAAYTAARQARFE